MPLSLLAEGPAAAPTAAVLARMPRAADGSPVAMGSFSLYSEEDDSGETTDAHLVIEIDEFIGWWTTDQRVFKRAVKRADPSRITLRISSLGGFVIDALAIHDFLRDYGAEHEVQITAYVNSFTASSATIVACAADPGRLFMSESALYLVHEPWIGFWGNRIQIQQAAEDLDSYARSLRAIYHRRTGRDHATIEADMGERDGDGKWWDAEEAVSRGYVDAVYVPGEDAPEGTASGAHNSRRGVTAAVACALGLPPLPASHVSPEASGETASGDDAPSDEELAALASKLDSLSADFAPEA